MKKTIIVDDEQPAVDKLNKMLKKTGYAETVQTFTDPFLVPEFIKNNEVDLAFLDIEMPGMNGMELADKLMEISSGIHIIFVTAYNEYAVEAFRINALDYLMKPVEMDRLKMALNRLPKEKTSANIAEKIEVNCFGKFTVNVNGNELKFRTAKAEELMAFFIDHNKAPVHRNTIMDLFWMDYDGDRATILFNTTLHYLKKAFIQQGVKLNIKFSRGAYTLDMPSIQCNGNHFVSRLKELKPLSKETLAEYEVTAALYSGNYLEKNEYGWAEHKRMLLKEKYAALIIKIAEYYKSAGFIQKAIDLLEGSLMFDPMSKGLNYCLFELLLSNHDKVAMFKHYDIYKTRLINEYGMEPDEDCIRLISSIS